MSIPRAQKFEHAHLRVADLSSAIDYWTTVVGLTEIASQDGVHYLGCGLDANYDLALSEGEPGLDHFALRADDPDELVGLQRRLAAVGVKAERVDGQEPGQQHGVSFALPSGQRMEVVVAADKRYVDPAAPALPRRRGFAPLDTCHVNLMATDVRRTATFLVDVVGLRLSEYAEPEADSGDWLFAFTRKGVWHHDVGLVRGQGALHHIAFAMASFEHIKVACDMIAASGHRLEVGPSRHPVASNLYVYVKLPGGHRVELSAEMATLDADTPTRVHTGLHQTLDSWGTIYERMPAGFLEGS